MIPAWFYHIPRHEVLPQIAAFYGLTPDDIRGASRLPHIVRARWNVGLVLRDRGLSLPAIGRLVNRHHTAVLHGLRRAG